MFQAHVVFTPGRDGGREKSIGGEKRKEKGIIKSSGYCAQVWVIHMTTLRPFGNK